MQRVCDEFRRGFVSKDDLEIGKVFRCSGTGGGSTTTTTVRRVAIIIVSHDSHIMEQESISRFTAFEPFRGPHRSIPGEEHCATETGYGFVVVVDRMQIHDNECASPFSRGGLTLSRVFVTKHLSHNTGLVPSGFFRRRWWFEFTERRVRPRARVRISVIVAVTTHVVTRTRAKAKIGARVEPKVSTTTPATTPTRETKKTLTIARKRAKISPATTSKPKSLIIEI